MDHEKRIVFALKHVTTPFSKTLHDLSCAFMYPEPVKPCFFPSDSLAVHLVALSVAHAMAESINNSSAALWLQNGNLADDQEAGRCLMSLNTVIITDMSGETLCEVSIASDCTVRGLKKEIERSIHLPSVDQHLTCAEFTLDDESATVMPFAIDGAPFVVSMFVRPCEGHELKLIFGLLLTLLETMIQARMRQEPINN